MMSMFATLNQKSDELEEQLGQEGSMMPVAKMVQNAGTMNRGGAGCGDGDDLHKEEPDALKSQ